VLPSGTITSVQGAPGKGERGADRKSRTGVGVLKPRLANMQPPPRLTHPCSPELWWFLTLARGRYRKQHVVMATVYLRSLDLVEFSEASTAPGPPPQLWGQPLLDRTQRYIRGALACPLLSALPLMPIRP
jgi:hypothetical protein